MRCGPLFGVIKMALPLMALAAPIIKGVFGVIDQVVEDKDQANAIKAAISERQHSFDLTALKGQIDIIVAETGGSFLAANWRPITMLTFVVLIVMWWFGFTPERATDELMLELFQLIKIGLGGYVVGRSAEKVAKVLGKQ